MTEMARSHDDMSDEAFRSLAAAVIRGESRELPRPLPNKVERKARPKVELPPLGTPRPHRESLEPVSKALVSARAEARAAALTIDKLETEFERVKAGGARKREIRDAMLAVGRAKRSLAKIEERIERLERPARAAAGVLRATVGLHARAIDSDRQMQADRERKPKKPIQRQTRQVKVESPLGPLFDPETGKRINDDHVTRVVDTIDLMLKQRQIDRDQEAAARMVQDAWAIAPGNIRCALSAGEGGAGPGSRSPTEMQMWAGRILNDVRRELGRIDSLVVIRICGLGMTVAETAAVEFAGHRTSKREQLHIGMRLRMALALLANVWGLRGRRPHVGAGSANLRSATARNDEFVLRSFETSHVGATSLTIGVLDGGNAAEIEVKRQNERELKEREEKRSRYRQRKKSGAQAT